MQLAKAFVVILTAIALIGLVGIGTGSTSNPAHYSDDRSYTDAVAGSAAESELIPAAPQNSAMPDATNEPTAALVSIGHLRSRKHTISIYSSPDGPRFTVVTEGGTVLAEELSVGEIQARLPEVYSKYRSTFARSDSQLDARVSPHAAELPAGRMPGRVLSEGVADR